MLAIVLMQLTLVATRAARGYGGSGLQGARPNRSGKPRWCPGREEVQIGPPPPGEFVKTPKPPREDGGLEEPLETRLMKRCPAHFDKGESLRIDIDAERVETPIGEGDGRTESNITQAYERYGQAVLAQGHISGGSSSAAVLDPRSTTDAFLWSLVPHANRRPPMRTGGQRPEAPRILNYRPIYGSCECSYPSYGTAR